MPRERYLIINDAFLNKRLKELELKQYELADRINVSPRTVIRWVHGQIKRVKFENIEKLAVALSCSEDQLVVQDDQNSFANKKTKKETIKLIHDENLVHILGELKKWDLLESILKSLLDPALDKAKLGELYLLLSHVKFNQEEYDMGLKYALLASEAAEKTQDTSLIARSYGYIAISYGKTGDDEMMGKFARKFADLEGSLDPELAIKIRGMMESCKSSPAMMSSIEL